MSDVFETPADGTQQTVHVESQLKLEQLVVSEATRELVTQRCKKIESITSLTDLQDEYIFFNHGAIFCYGNWPHEKDPLMGAAVELNKEIVPYKIVLPKPVFKFLDEKVPVLANGDWNSTVIAIHKDDWTDVFNYMASIGGVDKRNKYFVRFGFQKLPIVDTLALSRAVVLPDPIPVVNCVSVCLFTNKSTVVFCPEYRKNQLDPIPVLVRTADPIVKKFAKSLFDEVEKPLVGSFEVDVQTAMNDARLRANKLKKLRDQ